MNYVKTASISIDQRPLYLSESGYLLRKGKSRLEFYSLEKDRPLLWQLDLSTEGHMVFRFEKDGKLWLADNISTTCVVDRESGELEQRVPFNILKELREGYLIGRLNEGKYEECRLDLATKRLTWCLQGSHLFEVHEGGVLVGYPERTKYGVDKSKLARFDPRSGSTIWLVDFLKIGQHPSAPNSPEVLPGKVAKIIGVWREELLVSLHGGKVIALDLADGTLRRSWWKLELPSGTSAQIGAPYTLHFDEKQGKLFSLNHRFYWEIDLVSGSLSGRTLDDAFHSKESISFWQRWSTFNGSHLFIAMTRNLDTSGGSSHYLTAVNRKSLEIDWKFELPTPDEEVSISEAPKLEGIFLFFLANGALHIFERTT